MLINRKESAMASRAAGWPSDVPTAAQLKDFFVQVEAGRITEERFQSFFRENPAPVDMRNFPVEELSLGIRSYHILKRVDIDTVGDLVKKTEDELLCIPNFGKSALEDVMEALAEHGLALRGEELPVTPSEQPRPEPEWQLAIIKLYEVVKLLDLKLDAAGIQGHAIDQQLDTLREEFDA